MEIVMKRVGSLKGQPYNPPNRTESTSLATLVKSIKADGILMPLLINSAAEIIDGHRRYAAAKVLKLKEVPCVMTETNRKEATARAFEQVNTSQKRLGAKDMIYVYANGGNVPPKIEALIMRLEALIGADQLDKVATMSISCHIIDSIQKVAHYCHKDRDDDFKRKVFDWLLETMSVFRAMQAIEFGVPPVKMADAVMKNEPLKLAWTGPAKKRGRKK